MTTPPQNTSPPPTTTQSSSYAADDQLPSELSAPRIGADSASAGETSSQLPAPAASSALATSDARLDDGFSDSVPFQALNLRINRSKGYFQLEGDQEERKDVYLVPRGTHASKQYYGLPYDPKTPHDPSCASPDARHGYGWIDQSDQTPAPRLCATCPRRGYGAGTCDDLQILLAYDLAKSTPVLVQLKNAEINPRKGVFTLAVNRMRTMGAKATDCVFKLSFAETDGPYFALQIDVVKISDADLLDPETADEIASLLDNCWVPLKQGVDAASAELARQLGQA